MARNISISVSVQDQYSQSISSMREKTVAFNKDIEELTAKIKSLNKEKISLIIDYSKRSKHYVIYSSNLKIPAMQQTKWFCSLPMQITVM